MVNCSTLGEGDADMKQKCRTESDVGDFKSDASTCDDMHDSSPSRSTSVSSWSADLRDEEGGEDEEMIRLMQRQLATGKWQNENQDLIRVMLARW